MKILVDGVFFQLATTGIARLWSSIFPKLAVRDDLELLILDRGGMLPEVAGAKIIPFPAYKNRYTADDSFLIQKICDYFNIDLFISTYYTSCISTPMLLIIYDMIPELFNFDLTSRFWQEKEIAISFARKFIAISHKTKEDLLHFYPEIPEGDVIVTHLGVDNEVFQKPKINAVKSFCKNIDFDRPYFLLVGSREQNKGYKNTQIFFQAVNQLNYSEIDILCLGGEEEIEASSLAMVPNGCRIKRLVATDAEMGLAYAGAAALIYPSLYEGFGLPVVEAMASGCPVITTTNGALAEIVGDACIIIDAHSLPDMVSALQNVQIPKTRSDLISKGFSQAKKFTWEKMVQTIELEGRELVRNAKSDMYTEFFQNWKELRYHQASVDIEKL